MSSAAAAALAISLMASIGLWAPSTSSHQIPVEKQKPKQEQDPEPPKVPDKAQVIAVDTTVVILNMTVTDSEGRHVRKLSADDFEVLEDRVPQHILSLSSTEMPFAAAILLDSSGSMDAKMSLARAACSSFVEGIRDGDVFAIYGFGGTKVKLLQDFTEVRDAGFAIWDEDARGMTPLYDCIVTASEALSKRSERRKAILLVSDGADTQSKVTFEKAMRTALDADVAVYGVDLSDSAINRNAVRDSGAEAMKQFATRTGGKFFRTPGGAALRSTFVATVEELRNQYTLVYEPTNEKADGKWRSIEVRPRRLNVNVRTRQGYFARK